MKISRGQVSMLVLLFLFAGVWSCGESYEEKKAREEQARKDTIAKSETQRTQALTEFSKTYNADTTWRKSLEGKSPWTLTLQNSLMRADGRPIAGYAHLLDVARKDRGYVFDLALTSLSFSYKQDLVFRLECNPPRFEIPGEADLTPFIFNGLILGDEHYMFAARIHNVQRAIMRLDASATGTGEREVEVSTGTRFIASGECLALKYIGDSKEEKEVQQSNPTSPPVTQKTRR